MVRPLADETALRYQDWVAGRRQQVVELSGGLLGYVHVPDMSGPGWAQLHRDLRREFGRDGLVVDVRGNTGGNTSQLVVEKLARQVTSWKVARHRPPRTYPLDAPRGPVVALADELTASDGDIITAWCDPSSVSDLRAALEAAGLKVQGAGSTMVPSVTVPIDDVGEARKILRLLDALEDNDDVQEVYANFDASDDVLEAALDD